MAQQLRKIRATLVTVSPAVENKTAEHMWKWWRSLLYSLSKATI